MKLISLKSHRILIFIFLCGLLVRTLFISDFPSGFTPDEASFGYDAYSLLQTGRDQWGRSFPLVLESFGDFKPPLYAYILMPFINVFGLNHFSVRLPNALLGSLSILVIYLLFVEILKKDKKHIALIASFLLSISSWHIMMSRGAFEANLSTFLIPLGVLLFFKGLKKEKFLPYSSFVLGLNLFSYHSSKIVTPLIFVALIAFWFRDFTDRTLRYKTLFVSIFTFFIVLTAISFSQGAGARASDISVFSGAQEAAAAPRLALIQNGMPEIIAKALQNKYSVSLHRFVVNYQQYFSYTFLFEKGPKEATYGMIPGRGVLYTIEIVALVGFTLSLFKKEIDRAKLFFLFWLIVSPIPAALAQGVGYAGNRSVVMLPAYVALSAYGLEFLYRKIKIYSVRYAKNVAYIFIVVFAYSFSIFLIDYFISLPVQHADAMLFGRQEAIHFVNANNDALEPVVINTSLSEPHIYVAFYGKVSPDLYQLETKRWSEYRDMNLKFLDQLPEYRLLHFTFVRDIQEYQESFEYLIAKPKDFEYGILPEKIVYYPNGQSALYIVKGEENYYADVFKK